MNLEFPKRLLHKREELAEKLGVQELYSVNSDNMRPILEILIHNFIDKNGCTNFDKSSRKSKVNVNHQNIQSDTNDNPVGLSINLKNSCVECKDVCNNESSHNNYCSKYDSTLKIPSGCSELVNGRKKLQKFHPSLETIKYFLNSVSKGKLFI